jgi:hypothetical protein
LKNEGPKKKRNREYYVSYQGETNFECIGAIHLQPMASSWFSAQNWVNLSESGLASQRSAVSDTHKANTSCVWLDFTRISVVYFACQPEDSPSSEVSSVKATSFYPLRWTNEYYSLLRWTGSFKKKNSSHRLQSLQHVVVVTTSTRGDDFFEIFGDHVVSKA